jgi:hypothetical protein
MTIYQRLKAAGVPLDNHYSDLYAQVTPVSTAIIKASGSKTASQFRSQIDGQLWWDIPFAYDPYWEQRGEKA